MNALGNSLAEEQPNSSTIESTEMQPLNPNRPEEEDPITDSTNANDDQSENLQM